MCDEYDFEFATENTEVKEKRKSLFCFSKFSVSSVAINFG
jgi:hypothetical protein